MSPQSSRAAFIIDRVLKNRILTSKPGLQQAAAKLKTSRSSESREETKEEGYMNTLASVISLAHSR
jgi:hypothetical protein